MKDTLKEMDYRKPVAVLLACALGLSLGLASSQTLKTQQDTGYCENIESQVVEKRNFSGNLACFPPEIARVNLSEEVENNSELRCVCRHEHNGIEQIIPISFSN